MNFLYPMFILFEQMKQVKKLLKNSYDVNQRSQAAKEIVDFLVAILTRSFYNYLKMTQSHETFVHQ